MHSHDLDRYAHETATYLHSLPRPSAQTGGAAPPALPELHALTTQIRSGLTPELAELGMHDSLAGLFGHGGAGGGPKKPFNPTNFIKNVTELFNGAAPFVTLISGLFGHPITLPPIPVPPAPTNPAPAGA